MRAIQRSVRTWAVVAATTLSLVTTAAPAVAGPAAAGTAFSPGSQGVGDPYLPLEGNGGYDVAHYDLNLSYDPATHQLGGIDTVTAVATQDLSRFDLDLTGFQVATVTVDGAPATFTRTGQELVITPPVGIPDGSTFTTAVTYAGTPKTVTGSPVVFGMPYGWIYTKDGAFVGCEPNAAHTWFPSNDHPSDKASFAFSVTVPSGRQVVANGTYAGLTDTGGQDTYVFDEQQPMPTYLATIDIGRWDFHQTTTPGGIPELTAVDPALAKRARHRHTVALTARITDYWAKRFGRYPFGSTGAIVDNVPDIGFSLETATRPLYGFVPDPDTASHELAHEWFGDSVSVRSWQHIWLNEGFATFGSWLWEEHAHGTSTLAQARGIYRVIGPKSAFWKQSIADPGRNQMFSGAVYARGGMTLAALRHKIGSHDFFAVLRTWAREHRHGNATTAQFTRLAQQVSGVPLHRFFHVWLWRQAKPAHL
ncbi:MAG: M1 family metallopeptidase [Nocardioidaceae bacterium]